MATFGCYKEETPGDSAVDGGTLAATMTAGESAGSGGSSVDGGDAADASAGSATAAESGGSGDGDGLAPLIASLCDWEFRCCSDGERDYRLGPFTVDAADCSERFVEQLHSNDDKPELMRFDLLYALGFRVRLDWSTPDPEAVAECKKLIDERTCTKPVDAGDYCSEASDPARSPCDLRKLFHGQQKVGDPCSEGLAGWDIECEAGSSCEEVDGTYVCVDKGLVDEFCEADHKCDQGLYCDISVGRCAVRAGENEHCEFKDPQQPDAGTESQPCLQHLTCDPVSQTCKAYCTSAYDCGDDSHCREGESCIPVDYDDHTYTFCRPRGATNGDRCDSDRDCIESMHCGGDSCRSDNGMGDPCAAENECEGGLYCDIGSTFTCRIVVNANQPCAADRECNPSTTIGCVTSDDGALCRTSLLANGDICAPGQNAGGNWCASGICEDATDDFIFNAECRLGASEGQECDEDDATFATPRCQKDLYCTEGVCRAKSAAGGACDDDMALQCANASCAMIWEGEYCTDAVPVDAAGVSTCDGED